MLTASAVLFDLDGTLVDTAPDFVRVLNTLRQRYQRPALPYDTIRPAVSAGARAMVQVGFPEYSLESDDFNRYRQEFLELYSAGLAEESRLFDGMDTLLQRLERHHIPWGVVTNKPRQYSVPLLAGLGLAERCAVLVCPDDVKRTKPDPEPLFLACQQLGVAADRAIYVGDHVRDIDAGKAAGMTTIAVGFGYIVAGESAYDWAADYTVDNVEQLLNLFPCPTATALV